MGQTKVKNASHHLKKKKTISTVILTLKSLCWRRHYVKTKRLSRLELHHRRTVRLSVEDIIQRQIIN